MRLIIVRHASIAYTGRDGRPLNAVELNPPLTALGRSQARALGERVAAGGLTAMYSAPAVRCLETAQAVCAAAGVRGLAVPWLGECGRFWADWVRRPPEAVHADFPALEAGPPPTEQERGMVADESAEAHESRVRAVRARCRRAVDWIFARHPRAGEERVCLCTHSALGTWGLLPTLAGAATLTPENSRFLLDHASYTEIRCDDRGNLVLRVNCTRHLAGLTAAICSRPGCAYVATHLEERRCRDCGAPLLLQCPTCRVDVATPVGSRCVHCGHAYHAQDR